MVRAGRDILRRVQRSKQEGRHMGLGYEGKLFILAFDHRGSFQKKWFGIEGEPTPEETAQISDAKHLIFEGLVRAAEEGSDPTVTGALVDEQFGGTIPEEAKRRGVSERYEAELRPELMRRTIADIQHRGIEVDVWKIEGVDERSDCEMLAEQTRSGGRDGVACVLLGRGADDDKVDHWLTQAAPVEGFVGFAIGRSIWGDPLKQFLAGDVQRDAAAEQIGRKYP